MADLWFDPDTQFIGAIGPTTLRELAEAIHDDDTILATLDFDNESDTTIEDVENALDHLGVRTFDVDDDMVDADHWPDTSVNEVDGDQPSRPGTTRVLGVHI
ncbi:hypothetical protein [Curtobacterium sp. MCSS17_016]|uniref:hypothetical protein n=1 Tax=Curtobacterium sp. MCSS17_016 TaxID=2175644 RepID=UPI000DA82BC1|nr:hypothetical protein [Curtobacterium sp. MCSS17_016]WIE81196.1 hypothetical protein DEJ19_018355 [Curtobacterium sp. MCSS17_016]